MKSVSRADRAAGPFLAALHIDFRIVPAKESSAGFVKKRHSAKSLPGKQKNPAVAGSLENWDRKSAQAESPFTRCASRETLRDAVFLCSTPLVAARINSG